MRTPSSRSAARSQSDVIGVLLITAVAVILGATVAVVALDIGEELNQPQPEVSVEASFEAREELDPHWTFTIRHVSGDNIDGGELKLRLVDGFGNESVGTYPGSFTAGDTIRMGLWGSPDRADLTGVNCARKPEEAPGYSNQQLVDVDPPADKVDVVVVHEPTNAVMDRVEVDLGEYPGRYGTRLLDKSGPSFDCNDVKWRTGDVVDAS